MSDKMPKIQKYEHQKEKINKNEVDKHKIIHRFVGGWGGRQVKKKTHLFIA